MKKLFITTALVAGLAQFGFAANLKVPRSVFNMDKIEDAKAKAAENEKPLIFVYTDPNTT